MPTVVGSIRNPVDGSTETGPVTFQLVGEAGRPLAVGHLSGSNAAIEGTSSVDLSSGSYSVVLPSNDLILPAGTRWKRTHARSGPVLLYVTETPASQDEEDILAEAPGTLASAALDTHAADTTLHGGGQELAIAQLSAETSTTGVTTDVVGALISFEVPDPPLYRVELYLPIKVSASGVIANVYLVNQATGSVLQHADLRGVAADDFRLMVLGVRVPSLRVDPSVPHAPAAGSTATYKAQMGRTGTAGTASTVITFGGGPVIEDAYLRAVTC